MHSEGAFFSVLIVDTSHCYLGFYFYLLVFSAINAARESYEGMKDTNKRDTRILMCSYQCQI